MKLKYPLERSGMDIYAGAIASADARAVQTLANIFAPVAVESK